MDAQLKKGSLEVCVLTALLKEDSYGYKIIQDLDGVLDISESTLYPILKRLETNKLVNTYSVEHNGRLRRFYRITSLGKKKILTYIEDFKELLTVYEYIVSKSKKV